MPKNCDHSMRCECERCAKYWVWRDAWVKARSNVGSRIHLRRMLGYRTNSSASQHVSTAIRQGTKPKGSEAQQLLLALASVHGPTFYRAWCYKTRTRPYCVPFREWQQMLEKIDAQEREENQIDG